MGLPRLLVVGWIRNSEDFDDGLEDGSSILGRQGTRPYSHAGSVIRLSPSLCLGKRSRRGKLQLPRISSIFRAHACEPVMP
jgi:hypothetical protein